MVEQAIKRKYKTSCLNIDEMVIRLVTASSTGDSAGFDKNAIALVDNARQF